MTETTLKDRRLLDIKLILKDMLKVTKVVAMYPEGNPLPQSLKRSFAEKLTGIIEVHGDICLSVSSDTLTWEEYPVFTDSSKEESFAALFFKTGITSFTLKEGLDVLEIYKLLDVIKKFQNEATVGADLVCLLWEANFEHFGFTTIEDIQLAEYDGDFKVKEICLDPSGDGLDRDVLRYSSIFTDTPVSDDAGDNDISDEELAEFAKQLTKEQVAEFEKLVSTEEGQQLIRHRLKAKKSPDLFYSVDPSVEDAGPAAAPEKKVDSSTLRVAEAAKAMGFSDLKASDKPKVDTTLILNDEFKLSEEDELEIKKLLEVDSSFDMYESTIELLKELLFQESELSAFFETVSICEKIIQDFVSYGRLTDARHMLEYIRELEAQLQEDKPLWAERLRDARVTAGSREKLKFLVDTLNGGDSISMQDLRDYLDLFGWESLGSITDLLGELQQRAHREALCDYLSVRGRDNIAIVSKGMFDKRWYVVRNSVAILARLDDEKAMAYLQRAVTHEDRRVRLELMRALKDSKSPRAMDILRKAAVDPDVEIRREAFGSIVARGGQLAFKAVSDILTDDTFPTFEQNEQQKILTAYSTFGGAHALEYLSQLVSRPNFFRDALVAFYRKAAFVALAHNVTPEAEQLLLKLSSSWRPDVRRQAKACLEQRTQYMTRHTVQAAPTDQPQEVRHGN